MLKQFPVGHGGLQQFIKRRLKLEQSQLFARVEIQEGIINGKAGVQDRSHNARVLVKQRNVIRKAFARQSIARLGHSLQLRRTPQNSGKLRNQRLHQTPMYGK